MKPYKQAMRTQTNWERNITNSPRAYHRGGKSDWSRSRSHDTGYPMRELRRATLPSKGPRG